MSITKKVVKIMMKELIAVSLSNTTVKRRTVHMSDDVLEKI